MFLLHALHKYPHRRTDSLPGMVGAERMDRQWRLAEWQLNQRPALELVLHRKAWQKTHSQISRHALLDTLNTPQLNGVLQSNFALAQGAFKNLPERTGVR